MATSVVMPALEMAQETGKIVSWLKKEDECVAKGKILLEVETDKAVVEIEATADDVLAGIKSHEGDVVPVGRTIAWLVAPGEEPPVEAPAAAPAARAITATPSQVAGSVNERPGRSQTAPAEAVQISPKARRLAKEKGVDISKIRGTGPDGTITSDDVLKAAEAPAESVASALSAVARLMAERTTQSWTQVPHFFLVRDLEATALIQFREQYGRDKITI